MGGILVPFSAFSDARERRRRVVAAYAAPATRPGRPDAGAAEPLTIDSEAVVADGPGLWPATLRAPQPPSGPAHELVRF